MRFVDVCEREGEGERGDREGDCRGEGEGIRDSDRVLDLDVERSLVRDGDREERRES